MIHWTPARQLALQLQVSQDVDVWFKDLEIA